MSTDNIVEVSIPGVQPQPRSQKRSYPQPYGNTLLVRLEAAPEVLPSGLAIPDMVRAQMDEKRLAHCGEVLAVGRGEYKDGVTHPIKFIVPGDKVWWNKYAGSRFELGGEQLCFLSAVDIRGTEPSPLRARIAKIVKENPSKTMQQCAEDLGVDYELFELTYDEMYACGELD